jgi:hypothetical protein
MKPSSRWNIIALRAFVFAGALLAVLVYPLIQPARAADAGTVAAWGCQNGADYGQCAVPAGLTGVTAIAAGSLRNEN